MTQDKIEKIKRAVDALIYLNGRTTTLEVKTELRKAYPSEKWYQDDVSDIMDGLLLSDTSLKYIINPIGTQYRIYSKEAKLSKITKTELAKKVVDELFSGKTVTIGVFKNDNIEEKKYKKTQGTNVMIDVFGYIDVLNENNELRKLDPRKLRWAIINGVKYVVDGK